VLAALTAFTAAAHGQGFPYDVEMIPRRGAPAEGIAGPAGSIDAVTGNLHLEIFLAAPPPGKAGIGFPLKPVYDAHFLEINPGPAPDPEDGVVRRVDAATAPGGRAPGTPGGWNCNFQVMGPRAAERYLGSPDCDSAESPRRFIHWLSFGDVDRIQRSPADSVSETHVPPSSNVRRDGAEPWALSVLLFQSAVFRFRSFFIFRFMCWPTFVRRSAVGVAAVEDGGDVERVVAGEVEEEPVIAAAEAEAGARRLEFLDVAIASDKVAVEAVEDLQRGFAVDGAEIAAGLRRPDDGGTLGLVLFAVHPFKPNPRRMSS
jgi:hypothetical protein